MPRTNTIVIGAGQAGLAMSRCLSDLGVDHAVLERGRVAQRWRSHGWDSLRLLTPNWMTRLPGFHYDGSDPDGFMAASDVITFLERYASASRAPIVADTTVQRVSRADGLFRVDTNHGSWIAEAVVIATGYCDVPVIPAIGRQLAASIEQIVPAHYRRPDQLPPGGVLVVGASSTGVQLADEIQRSGRHVTLAAGRHTRLPRRYRGRDILWWLDRLGVLDQRASDVHDLVSSRRQPSLQLVGRPDHASLDLRTLHGRGVTLTGRILSIDGHHIGLDDDLVATTSAADIKMAEVLIRIDRFIEVTGAQAQPREAFQPTWTRALDAPSELHLQREHIATVIWATGYRRSYPWLKLPVLGPDGEIQHDGGVTAEPGLFVLGLNFQRRRNSSFIDGVGHDAREIAQAIAAVPVRQRIA